MASWVVRTSVFLRASAPGIAVRWALAPLRGRRRHRHVGAPMPAGWRALAEDLHRAVLQALPEQERELFFLHLKVFALGTRFLGANGFVVEDHHRIIIAGRAALMSRNLSVDVWDALHQIVIYEDEIPPIFHPEPVAGAVVGPSMVLSWDAVDYSRRYREGYDIVIHELAHVLDYGDLVDDGVPAFERLFHSPESRARYVKVVSAEYRRLIGSPGEASLGEYARTNRAEFFAVAAEMFFERPEELERLHPELHAVFGEYFRVG